MIATIGVKVNYGFPAIYFGCLEVDAEQKLLGITSPFCG